MLCSLDSASRDWHHFTLDDSSILITLSVSPLFFPKHRLVSREGLAVVPNITLLISITTHNPRCFMSDILGDRLLLFVAVYDMHE